MKIQAQAHKATITGDIYSVAGGLLAMKSPKSLVLNAENGNRLELRFDSYVSRTGIHMYSDEPYNPIIAVCHENFSELIDTARNSLQGNDIADFNHVLQSLSQASYELETNLNIDIA